MVWLRRRAFLGGVVSAGLIPGPGQAQRLAGFDGKTQLAFLDGLPRTLVDDIKLLLSWVSDIKAAEIPIQPGETVDRRSGLESVRGFSGAPPMTSLVARYRLLAPAYEAHDYYGLMLGLLSEGEEVSAVLLINRLFRLPVVFYEPLGLGSDLWANAGLILGFRTALLRAALDHAGRAWTEATKRDVPLIVSGQSQAGGEAQLQVAHLVATKGTEGRAGFVTFNANCSPASVRRLGNKPGRVPGVNFSKDLDPGVGPHAALSNSVGLQVYIHPDGTAGLTPRSSYFAAMFHPHEHFLESFNDVSLTAALQSVRDTLP